MSLNVAFSASMTDCHKGPRFKMTKRVVTTLSFSYSRYHIILIMLRGCTLWTVETVAISHTGATRDFKISGILSAGLYDSSRNLLRNISKVKRRIAARGRNATTEKVGAPWT
jgi:hypothetical protein